MSTDCLSDGLVLMETILCDLTLLQFDAQIEELLHQWLVRFSPCSVTSRFDHLEERFQGTLFLAYLDEFCKGRGERVASRWDRLGVELYHRLV